MQLSRKLRQQQHQHFYVIFITVVYVTSLARAAITHRNDSLEDLAETPPETSPFAPCRLKSNSTLDCSNLQLTALPKNIPNTISNLNLSFNSLQSIDAEDFSECCENVRTLDLSHNDITTLNSKAFEKLKNLEFIDLSSNKISNLDSDTFVKLKHLTRLNLSKNQLELPRGVFLTQASLQELNLDDCGIEEIPEETFVNMTQLVNLTLAGNPLDEYLDTSAFEYLRSLLRLRIKNLTQDNIKVLCNRLTAIDTINFDEFDLSCTILSDNVSFEEAIVTNDAMVEPKIYSVVLQPTTTKIPDTTTPTTATTSKTTEAETEKPQEPVETTDGSTNKTNPKITSEKVEIADATVKYILIGIFGTTIVGILIGLICRADVCGIKTKMCRSKTNNRRTPTDTVSPFEEIPLNTVNGNSVKTTEGHG